MKLAHKSQLINVNHYRITIAQYRTALQNTCRSAANRSVKLKRVIHNEGSRQ